ncbi:(d)CMP kinase [Saccharopolyspora montiporae]|uniref:(d)CMP kinase n=1 Tax=Saccharopolyspora montiporae TaxID=2781240 RepID=UPI00351C6C92
MVHAQLRGAVALDGPSGTGKSTVSRRLAIALGATYLDTGAMYRAATLAVLRAGVDPGAAEEATAVVAAARMTMGTDPRLPGVGLDGEDVAEEIRGAEVTGAVSAVSAVGEIRELLVQRQRELVRQALAEPGGVVVEGRDIGTVVLPDAGLKVYLTASADARAQRRTEQDVAEGRTGDLASTRASVQRRDALDSGRAVAPLRAAGDALELDTTELGIDQVVTRLQDLAAERDLLSTAERSAG